MRMIRRRACILCKPKVSGEIQFINELCDVACLIWNIGRGRLRLHQLMQQNQGPRSNGSAPKEPSPEDRFSLIRFSLRVVVKRTRTVPPCLTRRPIANRLPTTSMGSRMVSADVFQCPSAMSSTLRYSRRRQFGWRFQMLLCLQKAPSGLSLWSYR
jgi:hypothetical protein